MPISLVDFERAAGYVNVVPRIVGILNSKKKLFLPEKPLFVFQ